MESFRDVVGAETPVAAIDGDRRNNRAANLRWDTYQANSDDMLRHGTRLVGSQINAKLTEGEVLEIRRRRIEGVSISCVALGFGACWQIIRSV